MGLIINCDLGENESEAQTRALLGQIDAANIGCGVHAGSAAKTAATIALAHEMGVKVGAHPGVAIEGGRGQLAMRPDEFCALLESQVGGFLETAGALGASVHHLKLHGSLYHAVEVNPALREALLDWLSAHTDLVLFSMAEGVCLRAALDDGRVVYGELFADRGYLSDGRLVPRGAAGALIDDVGAAVSRLKRWLATGRMQTVDGSELRMAGDTVCVHSDSPHSLELLSGLRTLLAS
ncbi:MAG: 5-oxoprolinase subunit PxpA [Verrucomicrobiota bacterium]